MNKFSLILFCFGCFILTVSLAADNNQDSNIQLQLQRLEQAKANASNPNSNNATIGKSPSSINSTSNSVSAVPTPSTDSNSTNKKSEASQATAALSSVSDQAFVGMSNSVLPLSPEQIKTLRALFNASQKAASTYPGVSPRPTSSDVIVNLAPGATPPIVRLRGGYVTSLVFVDSTGASWPIKAYDIGDPKAFNVVWDKKSNVLL